MVFSRATSPTGELALVGLFRGLLKSPCPPPNAPLSRFYAVLFMDSQAIFK
jgi:hypothetical protein